MSATTTVALWGALFVLTHLIPSHPPIRTRLVGLLGMWPYRAVFSVIAAITLGGLCIAWWQHRHEGALLFSSRYPAIVHTVELTNMLGFGLLAGGAIFASPSSITFRGETTVVPKGVVALTRHPVNMGLAIVALGHMAVNGWATDLLFWGTLVCLALLGAMHEDYRKSSVDERYRQLRAVTTLLPWPTPARLRQVGGRAWGAFAMGAVGAAVLRAFHAQLFSG